MTKDSPNQHVFKTDLNGRVQKVKDPMISCYYLDQVCDATESLNGEDYVIGAGYKHGDCQIGVTGSVSKILKNDKWVEEDPSITAGREMMEEVGLAPKEPLKNYITISYGKITMYVFLVDANMCRPVTIKESMDSKNVDVQYKDIKTKKVLVLIYGPKSNLKNLLSDIRYQIYSTDKTVYVGMLPICKIKIWKDFFNKEIKSKKIKFPKFRDSEIRGYSSRPHSRKKHRYTIGNDGWITVSYSR